MGCVIAKRPHRIPDRKCGEWIKEATSACTITPLSSQFLWEEWTLSEVNPVVRIHSMNSVLYRFNQTSQFKSQNMTGKHGKQMNNFLLFLSNYYCVLLKSKMLTPYPLQSISEASCSRKVSLTLCMRICSHSTIKIWHISYLGGGAVLLTVAPGVPFSPFIPDSP